MSERAELRELAARCGIALAYTGYDGRRCEVPDETCEALLAAMGIDASSEQRAAEAQSALASSAGALALAPVHVVRAGSPACNRVALALPPGARGPVQFRVELRLEQGAVHALEGVVEAAGDAIELPMPAPTELSFGYHALRCELDGALGPATSTQDLIVVPERCVQVSERIGQRRALGVWTHLYTLASRRNAGIGDACDLHGLLRWAAGLGLDFVGINPLHAVDDDQSEVSPYYPLSRWFRNPIYLDLAAAVARVGAREAEPMLRDPEFAALRALPRIGYARVWQAKRRVLEVVHRVFAERHRDRGGEPGRAYAAYRRREGQALLEFATFCALRERLLARDPRHGDFRTWPEPYRDARGAAVARFAIEHAEVVDFHCYLQFELDEQLDACQRAARDAGMAIGVYGDLAVGDAPFAADVWARPALYARGASIGAPPDAYSDSGQEWGITPLNPLALRADRYRFYRGLLQRAFRHTGMLRIDHAMGLRRQFWVPEGRAAAHGAYVHYPEHDLFGLVALESRRALSLVVGEDLGVVPEGFREQMAERALLRSHVLYFERGGHGEFVRPADYAEQALITASTHDLPPLGGFLTSADLQVRRRAGNIASDEALARAALEREHAKRKLLELLQREGLLDAHDADPQLAAIADAVHRLIASGAPRVVGIALDDLTLEVEALNTPAASLPDAPNWSRRSRMTLERLASDERVRAALRAARARAQERR